MPINSESVLKINESVGYFKQCIGMLSPFKLHLSYCVVKFGKISVTMIIIEGYLVWYICEKVFKNQYEFDQIGMAECLKFFTVTLSTGMTFLVSSVGKLKHEQLLRLVGLPLDFSEKYLVKTR